MEYANFTACCSIKTSLALIETRGSEHGDDRVINQTFRSSFLISVLLVVSRRVLSECVLEIVCMIKRVI